MSIQIMSAVWNTSLPTHTMKLVLLTLADQANDHGICWPSIDTLARRCDLSRQSILDQIDKLIANGQILVEPGNGRRSNRYTVVVNGVDHKTDPVAVNGVDPSSQRRLPQQSTAHSVVVNGVDSIRKEPPLNPKRSTEPNQRPSISDVQDFCSDLNLPQEDAEWFFYKCQGNGWLNGGKPIKDWKATIRSWKAGGYLPSQKRAQVSDRPKRQCEII